MSSMATKLRVLSQSVIITLLATLILPNALFAQGSSKQDVVFRNGVGIGGVNVAVCQPLSTTAANVTSNLATFTMTSNPVTAGYVVGMQILVAGFTGGDTYLNAGTFSNNIITSGYTILSVTSTQIIVTLVHANATAGTNGSILQMGNTITPCAGLSTLGTDATLATPLANPVVSDGLGNFGFWAVPGVYFLQFYGPTVNTTLRMQSVFCSPNATGCSGGGGGSGTVTSITFSPPLTGGTITVSGTVGCPSCALGTGPFTLNQLIGGAGGQNLGVINLAGMVTTSGSNVTTIANGVVTEAMQNLTNVITGNVSISRHGYVPTLPNNANEYLDGTGNFSIPPSVNGRAIYATQYGVQANVNIAADATFVNGSQTVTIANSSPTTTPPFACPGNTYPCSSTGVGSDVGSIEFGTNMQFGNWNTTDILVVPKGTILSVQSPTQATVSTPAGTNCTSSAPNPFCFFAWGQTDDTTDLNLSFVAATTSGVCGTLILPQGAMFVSAAIRNTATNACGENNGGVQNFGSGMKTGYAVAGQGLAQSILVVLPGFDTTTCTVATNSCFWASGDNSGTYFHDWGILGGYNHIMGANKTALLIGANAIADRIAILALGINNGVILDGAIGIPSVIEDSDIECSASDVSGVTGYALTTTGLGSDFIRTSTFSCGYQNAEIRFAAPTVTYGFLHGAAQGNPAITVTSTWNSNNDLINGNGINGSTYIRNSGTIYFRDTFISDGTNGSTVLDNVSGGKVYSFNTTYTEVGSTPTAINNESGASFFDMGCCNKYVGTVTNNGAWFGSASVTGIALVSSNWSIPAGASAGQWGTSPSVGTCSGATIWEKCTITVGSSTIGSNPILTVTFPTPFPIPPVGCTATQVGGTQSNNAFVTGTVTATTAAFTYQTTPTASDTIIATVTGCVIP